MPRRKAKRLDRELNRASLAAQGIAANTKRRMRRVAWEADRSPSRLGRAGERAQQASAIITPAAASVAALFALAGNAFDLYVKYKEWTDRAQSTPAPKEGGHDQNDEPPF